MKVSDALSFAAECLARSGIHEHRREASSLLAFALQKPPVFLIAHPEYELSDAEAARFDSFVKRRSGREPFHYITGNKEFYGLDFEVTPDVLIPRPETEILVEAAVHELNKLSELSKLTFLEIGVGSGCISVSILDNVRRATAVATDISGKALAVARRNAERHGVADRLVLTQADLFAGIDQKFDMIVSNPPYIPDADLTDMQPEVRDYEPHNALFAGTDGLDIIRRIIEEAPQRLNPDGLLLIEIGFGHEAEVLRIFDIALWRRANFFPDLQQISRVVKGQLR